VKIKIVIPPKLTSKEKGLFEKTGGGVALQPAGSDERIKPAGTIS
jgi:hypothetical protein